MSQGTLFVVATPIGNLDDLSPRARDVLGQADIVAAEDTRVTGRLLSHLGIGARQQSLHDHNEAQAVPELIEALESGNTVALVSDAGTPLISDPGYRLVSAAHDAGIKVSPVPGPSAPVAALSVSGLPSDRFVFEGFLPARQGARRSKLETLESEHRTMLFFESVHRLADTIGDMQDVFGGTRRAAVGRELSKRYEQCVSGDLATLAAMIADGRIPLKGEFVLTLAGNPAVARPDADSATTDALLRELLSLVPGRQAADIVARVLGTARNDVYQRMLTIKDENS